MKGAVKLSLVSAAALVLAGCGVTGEWTLHTISPEEARGSFKLASVTLNDDGTYAAESQYGEELVTSTGKYTFEDGKLTFVSDSGKTLEYDAKLTMLYTRMEVKTQVQDQTVTAVMKRD